MKKALFKDKAFIVALVFLLGFTAWWLYNFFVIHAAGSNSEANTRFTVTYGLIAIFGGFMGLRASKKWGGAKSTLGRAILFFSLGLLAQEAGQLILTYYIYGAHVDVPYPSWGDAAYFGSTLLYITAGVFLAKAAGIRFSLKTTKYKFVAILVPIILLALSYAVFLRNYSYDFHQPLKTFLDFGYPMGDAIYISMGIIAFLLSRKFLGGVMRGGILLVIFALLVQYLADFTFLYQTSRGKWYAGGWNDYVYMASYSVMTIALIKFSRIYLDIRSKASPANAVSSVQKPGAN